MESSSKAAAWSVDLEDGTVRTPGPAETTTSSSPAPAATTRPYYECVFCKRGFTTAQALGGHMNIHRRDRDRLKPAPPARLLDAPATTKWYGHSAAYPPSQLQAASPMSRGSLPMLYYTGGAGAALFRGDADPAPLCPGTPSPRELTLFGAADDDHDPAALHLDLGWRAPERLAERRQDGEPAERKQLLDLELRLGPRPRH